MREALLYEKLPGSMTQCHTCQWRCKISPDKYGVCGMYHNRSGVLFNLNYAVVSSTAADPIEKNIQKTIGRDDAADSEFVASVVWHGGPVAPFSLASAAGVKGMPSPSEIEGELALIGAPR